MKINEKKSKEMIITFQKEPPVIRPVKTNVLDIDRVTISKCFGTYVSSDLKWDLHVDKIHAKAFKRLYFLTCLKRKMVLRKINCLTTKGASSDL